MILANSCECMYGRICCITLLPESELLKQKLQGSTQTSDESFQQQQQQQQLSQPSQASQPSQPPFSQASQQQQQMGMMNGGIGMGNMGGGGVTGFQPGPFPTSQPSMMGGQPMMTPGGGMMYSQPQRPPAPSNQVALYQSPQQFLQQQYGQVRREKREGRGRQRERGIER